ncbi:MAG: ATP-binding protein [Gammaproteobacteria bacterium]|nr:ATP-binding protein [Gammaproteobacteria bacterium]
MKDFDKLGAFYLGRVFDPSTGELKDDLLLYDSRDLTTHAMCVGMTGSGKTGLCLSLLEEAGIDGIPAIAIDPKGDLSNLFLTFPELRPEDFRPWVDEAEATRHGMTADEYARHVAGVWSKGLAQWEQDGARIARFRDACELTLFTPGSASGRPLRILGSLEAPGPGQADDPDATRDRIQGVVSGLLSLIGIDADPVRGREQILLSNLVERAWGAGRDCTLAGLIADIQSPPFERLGVMDLETFFPSKDRFDLAMSLNALLASPGFSAWMQGEPLDVERLLFNGQGRPRLSVISIAHLSERERMFFVSMLLNEIVAWVRTQPGTSSLRALLYMDEVYGYFPPTANPPSKTPMLTLLKQARAHGLGVVLATQNPVDLDYKGLSNMGTWFLGRLQTERDKARVLDGLEGASSATGAAFDRGELDRLLSGLGSRVFLMNNVHDEGPEVFQTRWALSYLRGPLTREQVRELAAVGAKRDASPDEVASPDVERERGEAASQRPRERPVLAAGVDEWFADVASHPAGARVAYRPRLYGEAQLHYANARAGVDEWRSIRLAVPLSDPVPPDPWEGAAQAEPGLAPGEGPEPDAGFASLPPRGMRAGSYTTWGKRLKTALYRDHPMTLYYCKDLRLYSSPVQDEAEFRKLVRQQLRERRDIEVEKLGARYAPKLRTLKDRIQRAEEALDKERSQHREQQINTVISLGATVLGALFGRKAVSSGSIGRAASTARRAGRTGRERDDVARASERLEQSAQKLEAMERDFEEAVEELGQRWAFSEDRISELIVRARKTDTSIDRLGLLWAPWLVGEDGSATPGWVQNDSERPGKAA